MHTQTYLQAPDGHVFQSDPSYHPDCKPMSAKAGKQADQLQCIANLRKILKPGDTVYTVLRHVSRSGMMRRIDLYANNPDGGLIYLSGYAAGALDYPRPDNGIKVSGCGMDMGFHLVYNLSRTIFSDGFTCTGRDKHPNRCPSNDHSNGDRNYAPHQH